MGLRAAKKAETRAAILKAAKKLFQEKGFGQTRVHDIGVEARVSDQTVFNYFPSKESLLSQLAIDWYEGSAAWLAAQRKALQVEPDLDRFLASLRTALNWAQGDRALLKLVVPRAQLICAGVGEGDRSPQEMALIKHFEANQRALQEIFEVFQRSGAIRDDVDPVLITESYGSLFQGALLHWAIRPVSSGGALGDRVVQALRVFLRGLEPAGYREVGDVGDVGSVGEAGATRTAVTTTSSRGRSFAPQRP